MPVRGRTPKKHVAGDGTVSWKVRFRTASDRQTSETFYDEAAALEFCGLLKALGPTRAIAYLDEQAKNSGGRREPALTLDQLFDQWIEWKSAKKKDGTLLRVRNPRTLADYRSQYERRIKKRFGSTPANLISGEDVAEWMEELYGELEVKTANDYHGLLHGLYLWGLHPTRGLVIHDPCADTELLPRAKKPPKGLRPDQWQILHAAAREVDEDSADVLLFMVGTSWRWSEVTPLIVACVDHWDAQVVNDDGSVSEESFTYVTMDRVLRRVGSTFEVVEDAKSSAGEGRRVRIKGAAEEMVLRRIVGKGLDDLVFTSKTRRRWVYSSFHQRIWTRPAPGGKTRDYAPKKPRILEVAIANGFVQTKVTPHWLRHSHVGFAIMAGEPLTAISRRVGHSSTKVTADIYGRMIDDLSSDGLDKMTKMIGGQSPSP